MTNEELWEAEIAKLRAERNRLGQEMIDNPDGMGWIAHRKVANRLRSARRACFENEDYLMWKLAYDSQ